MKQRQSYMHIFLPSSCFWSWNSIVVFVAEAMSTSLHVGGMSNEGCSAQTEVQATAFRCVKVSIKPPKPPCGYCKTLSGMEPVDCGVLAWVSHCKGEEGKGRQWGRVWVWGSFPAVLAKSRLSAERMSTVLKLGVKEQVPSMSLHCGPSKQGRAENTKPWDQFLA